MKPFSIIVAIDEKNGIGKNGTLAWVLSADLRHFKEMTITTSDPSKKNAVIMGRKTWDSLPEKFKPLPRRLNVVLSQNTKVYLELNSQGALAFTSLEETLKKLSLNPEVDQIFVIGGAQIYLEAVRHPQCHKLYVTELKGAYTCDAFFPAISTDSFILTEKSAWLKEGSVEYRFCQYQKSG